MAETGLRELKKARTRRHIAETAARLFAERGYEQVTVSEIARAAEVAEQTLYNYFPTKEQLVTDQEEQFQEQLSALIRSRAAGVSPAAAIRPVVLQTVVDIRDRPAETALGNLGSLAAVSPAINRLALETIDRLATAFAAAIADSTPIAPELARIQAIALAGVFQFLIRETGTRAQAAQTPLEISEEVYPQIENILDTLDRWQSL